MSTPFPLEEQAQQERLEPMVDPWKGPVPMSFGAEVVRSPYTLLEAAGSAAAKGEAVLGGLAQLAGRVYSSVGTPRVVGKELEPIGANIEADARERVKATTPDAATTGMLTRTLHSVGEGAYLLSTGALLGGLPGAAATVGGVEGTSRYQELREQGVTPGTAAAAGAVTAITSGAGALVPAAYGSTLLTRVLTGGASNTAFGLVNRVADHTILEAGGYHEMAEQQKVWDGMQMLVDAALGATFGIIHHARSPAEERARAALRQPENRDAALTMNLALRDRQSAPGVPVDPEAANAHQVALEKAEADLLQGKPVDVGDSGVDRATFLARPARDLTLETKIVLDSFKESGLLDEEANLKELEEQFAARGRKTEPEIEAEPLETPAKEAAPKETPSPVDPIEEALAERPNLQIPDENGEPTKASEALEEAKDKTDWKGAVVAATNCFMRKGA